MAGVQTAFPSMPAALGFGLGCHFAERDYRKRSRRPEEAEHASDPHCAFPHFLRLDGPAGRGTGAHDRQPAWLDPRSVFRQLAIKFHEKQCTFEAWRGGPVENSVIPGSDPRRHEARTRNQQASEAASAKTADCCFGCVRLAPNVGHDLGLRLEISIEVKGQVGYERSGEHIIAAVSTRCAGRSSGQTTGGIKSRASGSQGRAMVFRRDGSRRILLWSGHVRDQSHRRLATGRDFLPERPSHRTAQGIACLSRPSRKTISLV
jgi:hypothetical protein